MIILKYEIFYVGFLQNVGISLNRAQKIRMMHPFAPKNSEGTRMAASPFTVMDSKSWVQVPES